MKQKTLPSGNGVSLEAKTLLEGVLSLGKRLRMLTPTFVVVGHLQRASVADGGPLARGAGGVRKRAREGFTF